MAKDQRKMVRPADHPYDYTGIKSVLPNTHNCIACGRGTPRVTLGFATSRQHTLIRPMRVIEPALHTCLKFTAMTCYGHRIIVFALGTNDHRHRYRFSQVCSEHIRPRSVYCSHKIHIGPGLGLRGCVPRLWTRMANRRGGKPRTYVCRPSDSSRGLPNHRIDES